MPSAMLTPRKCGLGRVTMCCNFKGLNTLEKREHVMTKWYSQYDENIIYLITWTPTQLKFVPVFIHLPLCTSKPCNNTVIQG